MKMKEFLVCLSVIILISLKIVSGQGKTNYGNTPDEIFPFSRYSKAYKYHFLEPIGFYGSGREKPAPAGISEVRIGFLGPLEGSVISDLGKNMLNGAQIAIDEANAKGGYRGVPFRLMIHNDVGLWGAAANEIVKMDDEKVWCWLGSIDDIVSHVAIRATLKLEIPVVCTGDPDPTYTETNIPWCIRVISDDRQSGYQLVNRIYKTDGHSRVAVIRGNNRYGRVGLKIFSESSIRVGHPVIIEERFNDGETDFRSQLERIKKTNPDAILIWGNAKESGIILKQLREIGIRQPVYGSDRMVNPEFLEIAGPLANGIVTTCQYNPEANIASLRNFKINYLKKFGRDPDVFAAHAYDGMNILIEAIKKAGLNRVLIRDLLTDLKTFQNYQGVTGTIVFDGTWNDVGGIFMAEVQDGKYRFSPAPPLSSDQRISIRKSN
jgi:ABC-type branched-subunit amino acid transport system substrate-binding protein